MHHSASELLRNCGSPSRILHWQAAALLSALVMVLIAASQNFGEPNTAGRIVGFEAEQGREAGGGVQWTPAWPDHLAPRGTQRYRILYFIDPGAATDHRPLALRLSGLFSSEAYWNGVPIGANGRPADNAPDETPGKIDAVYFIPSSAIHSGVNEVVINISSNRNVLPTRNVFHRVSVVPYSDDARRSLREYSSPVIAIGALLFALAALRGLPIGVGRRDRADGAAIIGAAAAMATGEMARALINYPYPLHAIRLAIIVAGAAAFTIFTIRYAARFAAPAHLCRITATVTAIVILAALLVPGWDTKISAILGTGVAGAICLSLFALRKGDPRSLNLLFGLSPFVIAGISGWDQFLDNYFYVCLVPLIINIYLIERAAPEAKERRAAPTTENSTISFREQGKLTVLKTAQIIAVRAAGNYSDIVLSNGRNLLVSEALRSVHARLPEDFIRVHRSHIVNKDAILEIRAIGAGKYQALLSSGYAASVSRAKIAELRADLRGGQAALESMT